MTPKEILDFVDKKVFGLKEFSLDVLEVAKPNSIEDAVRLCKIVSKLSPLVGNFIEYKMVDLFNEILELKSLGEWRRQDPGFPDVIFDSEISPAPGIEIKAWFPLATEMTARFKDSQKFFAENQTAVLLVCWLPEFVIYGKPVILGTKFIYAKSISRTRDNHYFNPPDYLVLEPENTDGRTKNLQQTNTNGYKFQGTTDAFKKAMQFVEKNEILKNEYSLEENFQKRLRELFAKFKYRLDTNYAKIDRIQHKGIEEFKANMMMREFYNLPISSWVEIVSKPEKNENKKIISKKLGIN